MLTWNPLYGTGVRRLQGLGGIAQAGLGNQTIMLDDGSSYTIDDYGNPVSATEAPTYVDAMGNPISASSPGAPTIFSSQVVYAQNTPMNAGTGGNVQADPGFWGNLSNIFTAAVGAKQTYDVNQLNLELAKRGKPPLTTSQIQALRPGVNVGVTSDTQKTMLMIAGVLAASFILPKLLK